jgi:hypothetical protein
MGFPSARRQECRRSLPQVPAGAIRSHHTLVVVEEGWTMEKCRRRSLMGFPSARRQECRRSLRRRIPAKLVSLPAGVAFPAPDGCGELLFNPGIGAVATIADAVVIF